jgi:hypothetical protein
MGKSFHYIEILSLQSHLLISHLMIHRDLSENRDLRSSRGYFLLIKLSSSSVVTSIWSHQNRILIFVLIDLSAISKISRYERNHLDLNKSSRLNDRKTTRFEINRLMKKLTIRIVSNKQMRFEVESFVHQKLNDDVMRQKSADQIRWSNHLIQKISSRKKSSSIRSRFAISSIHLIISNYHDIASSTIFQHTLSVWHLDAQTDRFSWLIRWVMSIRWSCLRNFSCFCRDNTLMKLSADISAVEHQLTLIRFAWISCLNQFLWISTCFSFVSSFSISFFNTRRIWRLSQRMCNFFIESYCIGWPRWVG